MCRIVKATPTVFLLFVLVVPLTEIAARQRPDGPGQTHFSAEDSSVKHPVEIPKNVLSILTEDDGVRIALTNEGISAERIPRLWFSASAVHLAHSRDVDLVVMGEGPLRGSNVTTFWVFHATPSGYKLVLTAPAHDLILKNTRCNGFRDIVLTSLTAVEVSTVLLRFNGTIYTKQTASTNVIK